MINLFVIILGLLIGSFLNVCIYRIPKEETIILGRSHCIHCKNNIQWYDLIPVISYIVLRGHCRYCKQNLSIQYPLVELLNGVAYLGIYSMYGISFQTVIYCLLVSTLIVISIIDSYHYIIPDKINIFILILGIITLVYNYENWLNYFLGFFAASIILYVTAIVSKGGMGGGDIKLMAVTGLLIGWQNILIALVVGSIVGSIISILLLIVKKGQRTIPFGPYLSIGILFAILYGQEFLIWYLNLYK